MISDEYLVRKSDKSIIYQVDSSVPIDTYQYKYILIFRRLIWHGADENVNLVSSLLRPVILFCNIKYLLWSFKPSQIACYC